MIQSILIRNFQSHELTEIKFHKGINLFIGESDAGKSAIIRALNWVINNRPAGDSFRSRWGGKTKVSLVADGESVQRVKKGKENSYFCSGEKYEAFKSEVPKYVKEKLFINPVNLQKQMDSHFLFSLSSAEISRYLNKIVSLDSIDTITANAKKMLKDETEKLKYERERGGKLREEIKSLSWVKDISKKMERIERLKGKLFDISERFENLKSLTDSCKRKRNELRDILRKIKEIPDVDKVIKQGEGIKKLKNRIILLSDLALHIREYHERITRLDSMIKDKEAVFQRNFPEYCPLCGKESKKV